MLSNGWMSSETLPSTSGIYYTIKVFSVEKPENYPHLIVRDGDCIVEAGYFDGTMWEEQQYEEPECPGWVVVAWKPLIFPMLPAEYMHATTMENLKNRKPYSEESDM